MKKSFQVFLLFLFLSPLIHLLLASPLQGEEVYQERIRNLESLLISINNISETIAAKQKALESSRGLGREHELKAQIRKLSLKLKTMEDSFNKLSTEVDFNVFEGEKKEGFDWKVEVTELLGPVIKELKKLTSHPREIEMLRSKVELYKSQLPVTQKALKNIEILLTHTTSPNLIQKLKSIKKMWVNREQEVNTQMNIALSQLEQKLDKRKSLSQSFQEIVQIFFKSRGRNLIVSFLAFVFVLLILQWIHKLIQKYSPFHQKERSFYIRVFDMVYIFVTVVFSLLALLSVLYFVGDWVLLSIALIFILGIGWASKNLIPRFWNQGRLILNFGPVREGERVIYNGLPYKVTSINLFTVLVNKDLEGGRIRLPIKDLLEFRSRPIAENEPWFPSRRGDWVILNDSTYGRVTIQTPEIVEMELPGGASMTYRTVDYLSRSPMNLSSGFRLWITFGLDYTHKDMITQEIPPIFEKAIVDGLQAEGHGDCINTINVEFKEPGTYSLDMEIMADFKESAGSKYLLLRRTTQRICVDTCNRNNWMIPIQQVRVHMTEPLSGISEDNVL